MVTAGDPGMVADRLAATLRAAGRPCWRRPAASPGPGGLLIFLFHPSGRAALAARHGRTLEPDEPLAVSQLQRSTRNTGWCLTTCDDAEHRFLAIATRD